MSGRVHEPGGVEDADVGGEHAYQSEVDGLIPEVDRNEERKQDTEEQVERYVVSGRWRERVSGHDQGTFRYRLDKREFQIERFHLLSMESDHRVAF